MFCMFEDRWTIYKKRGLGLSFKVDEKDVGPKLSVSGT